MVGKTTSLWRRCPARGYAETCAIPDLGGPQRLTMYLATLDWATSNPDQNGKQAEQHQPLSADVRRFSQLNNADKVFSTHRGNRAIYRDCPRPSATGHESGRWLFGTPRVNLERHFGNSIENMI